MLVLALFLVACGGDTPDEEPTEETGTTEETTAEESAGRNRWKKKKNQWKKMRPKSQWKQMPVPEVPFAMMQLVGSLEQAVLRGF